MKDFKEKLILIILIVFAFFLIYKVHLNYDYPYQDPHEANFIVQKENNYYEYPLHGDEWTHLAQGVYLIENEKIPELNPYLKDSGKKLNLESGFHSFLAQFFTLTGLDPILYYQYLPAVFTIIYILTLFLFKIEIDLQHKEELNHFISDLENLDFEISKNLEFIDILINQKEEIINSTIYNEFIFENFKKELADGRINNKQLKHVIFAQYFTLKEFDNGLKNINSASFYLADPDHYKIRKRTQYNNFAIALNNTVKRDLIILRFALNDYLRCLNYSKDITKIDDCSKTPVAE